MINSDLYFTRDNNTFYMINYVIWLYIYNVKQLQSLAPKPRFKF